MKECIFSELGYFSVRECKAIKEVLDGYSFMNFIIKWINQAGNCTLVVCTDYDDTEEEIKTFFLHCALGKIFELKNA